MAEEGRPKISELATVPIQPAQWYTLELQLGLKEEVLNRTEVDQSSEMQVGYISKVARVNPNFNVE